MGVCLIFCGQYCKHSFLLQVAAELELAIKKYKPYAIKPGGKPVDPKADPKLHGNTWVPWM